MNSAPLAFQNTAPAAATPPTDRPPLTRRQAERLLWREEWRAHARTLGMGVALWIWLYLVPGKTAQYGQLLGWSIAWAGVCALLIAGRDLRHGIDPLIRTLAPPHHLRWHMRAAIILLASLAFYTLALFAIEGQWAFKLWSPLANGPFVADQIGEITPFASWQGLGVVAGAAMIAALAASCLHGVIFSVAFAAVFVVLATQLSGDNPGIVAFLTPNPDIRTLTFLTPESWTIGYAATTRILGFAGLGVAAGAWLMGAFIARRRPVITTHSSTAEAQAAKAGLAFSLLAVILMLFWARTILTGTSADSLTWAFFLPLVASVLLALWWAHIWHAQRSHSHPSRRSKVLAVAISLVTAAQLGFHPWQVFYLPVATLRETWPPVMEDLQVQTGQTASEAFNRDGSVRPSSLDVFLFTHFDTAYDRPFTLRSYTVEFPPPGESRHLDVELPLPGDPSALLSAQLNVVSPAESLQQKNTRHIIAKLTLDDPSLSPAAEALSYTTAYRKRGELLFFAHDRDGRLDLPLATKTAGLPITCRLLAIPRLPGQPSRELPWAETVNWVNQGWYSSSSYSWYTSSAYNIEKRQGPGVRGLLGGGTVGIFWLGIPFLVFGSFAYHYCRHWPWLLLGGTVALLLGMISLDGLRQEKLQRMASDPRLPSSQRNWAGGWWWHSYFHLPDVKSGYAPRQ